MNVSSGWRERVPPEHEMLLAHSITGDVSTRGVDATQHWAGTARSLLNGR